MPEYLVAYEIDGKVKVFESKGESIDVAKKTIEKDFLIDKNKHLWSEEIDESLVDKNPIQFWLTTIRKIDEYISKNMLNDFIRYIHNNYIDCNQSYYTEMRNTILTMIVKNDRIDFLKWIVKNKDIKPDIKEPDGSTAFHHVQSPEAIKLLKRAGFNIDIPDKKLITPLGKALGQNNFNTAFYLKKVGANANRDEMKRLLFLGVKSGCSLAELRELLDMGARVDVQDDNKNNLLHLCAEHNRVRLAKELIKYGVNCKGKNTDGCTPLHVSAYKNSISIAEVLLQKGKLVNVANNIGLTAICYAKSSVFVNLLLNNGADISWKDKDHKTPIFYASNKMVCKAMLKNGAAYVVKDLNGNLPIHLVKEKDVAEVLMAAYGNKRLLKTALESNNQAGRTPLHTAMLDKRFEVAKLLLIAGANPKVIDNHKRSILEALFNFRDVTGCCIYDKYRHEKLFPSQYRYQMGLESQQFFEGAFLIDEYYPECQDEHGNTLLHYASGVGAVHVIEALIMNRNYDVNRQNNHGLTPLHFATENNRSGAASYLFDSGADLDIADRKGGILPLHVAAGINSPEMITCLLRHGALINNVDQFGKKAIEYINMDNDNAKKCLEILAKNGADITGVEGLLDRDHFDELKSKEMVCRAARVRLPYSTYKCEPQFGPKRQLRILIENNQQILNQLVENNIDANTFTGLKGANITWGLLPSHKSLWGETLLEYLNYSIQTQRAFSKRWPTESFYNSNNGDLRPTWDAVGKIKDSSGEIKGYMLLIAVSSKVDIEKPTPCASLMNRFLIEKTIAGYGFNLGRHIMDEYLNNYCSSRLAEYRYIEREIVSNLLTDILTVPVYPVQLLFYNDKTIINSSSLKDQLNEALQKILNEVDKVRKKDQNNNVKLNSIYIEAFDPPDWKEHRVCYLRSSSVCLRHSKKKVSLVSKTTDYIEQYRKEKPYTFKAGKKEISVKVNLFILPEPGYEDVVVRVKFEGNGKKRVEKVEKRMQRTIEDLNLFFKSNERLARDNKLIGILVKLDYIMNTVTPNIECLKKWDIIMDELAILRRCMEIGELPLYYFIRPGFFLNRPIKSASGSLVAGCYVNANNKDIDKTSVHELAHAAIEVSMVDGAVAGCRWLDEAFAEYFAQLEGGFQPTNLSRCEGDVYRVWTTLADMKRNGNEREVEALLEKFLSPHIPTNICPEVHKLREAAKAYSWSEQYPDNGTRI